MLVSTIDGFVTAIDVTTGVEKWKFKESNIILNMIKKNSNLSNFFNNYLKT